MVSTTNAQIFHQTLIKRYLLHPSPGLVYRGHCRNRKALSEMSTSGRKYQWCEPTAEGTTLSWPTQMISMVPDERDIVPIRRL